MIYMSNDLDGVTPTPDNGSLFQDDISSLSVRVCLPGRPSRVISKFPAAGGFVFHETALGLPGFTYPLGCSNLRLSRREMASGGNTNYGERLGFRLGRTFLKSHVVRRCLGVLPGDADPHGPNDGPLSFVEEAYKPTHMRVGFFPRRDQPVARETQEIVVPGSNLGEGVKQQWFTPAISARASLDKLVEVKRRPLVRKAGEAPAGARLRRRAAWVLALNPDKSSYALGQLLKGRWTPDLSREFAHPMQGLFVAARGGAIKFLGGGTVTKQSPDGGVTLLPYVNACHSGVMFRLYPELLAKLATYATFRRREAVLVTALRTRAMEWLKQNSFSNEEAADTLGPTVALSYLPTAQEVVGQKILSVAGDKGSLPEAEGWWSAKD
uniref:Uncharacterized protein n=1 Tax=Alternaria dianthicola umbra-like virus 1 TaxID=2992034 RepID=A0A9E7V6R6_9TOMB|nr:hypothetical protein [Alternaria dianthicola umbra-like virus 1]